jgi:hypothetical protein
MVAGSIDRNTVNKATRVQKQEIAEELMKNNKRGHSTNPRVDLN